MTGYPSIQELVLDSLESLSDDGDGREIAQVAADTGLRHRQVVDALERLRRKGLIVPPAPEARGPFSLWWRT